MIKLKGGTVAILAGFLLIAFVTAGCANTIRGVGEDVNESADAVKESVE